MRLLEGSFLLYDLHTIDVTPSRCVIQVASLPQMTQTDLVSLACVWNRRRCAFLLTGPRGGDICAVYRTFSKEVLYWQYLKQVLRMIIEPAQYGVL